MPADSTGFRVGHFWHRLCQFSIACSTVPISTQCLIFVVDVPSAPPRRGQSTANENPGPSLLNPARESWQVVNQERLVALRKSACRQGRRHFQITDDPRLSARVTTTWRGDSFRTTNSLPTAKRLIPATARAKTTRSTAERSSSAVDGGRRGHGWSGMPKGAPTWRTAFPPSWHSSEGFAE